MSDRKRWTHLDQMVRSGMVDELHPMERASRAACKAAGYDWREESDGSDYPIADEWRAAARAVIEAIREPSPAMEAVGRGEYTSDYIETYKDMLDELLKTDTR